MVSLRCNFSISCLFPIIRDESQGRKPLEVRMPVIQEGVNAHELSKTHIGQLLTIQVIK